MQKSIYIAVLLYALCPMPFAQSLNPQILPDDNDDHFCAARFFTQRYIDIADAVR